MAQFGLAFAATVLSIFSAYAQTAAKAEFKLALPDHKGQLRWSANGFKIIQTSAKPNGREIGIRGQDESGRLTFLAFLFLIPEQAPLTGAKCRDGALDPEKKSNPTLKVLQSSEGARPIGLPVPIVSYTSHSKDGTTWYTVRGFIAKGDACGDLESSTVGSQSALRTLTWSRSFPAMCSMKTTRRPPVMSSCTHKRSIKRRCSRPRRQSLRQR